jgi:hypothetical protein
MALYHHVGFLTNWLYSTQWNGYSKVSIEIQKVARQLLITRVIRSMVGVSSRMSCRQLFKELNILTLASLYVLEVICFIGKYCQSLEINSNTHK